MFIAGARELFSITIQDEAMDDKREGGDEKEKYEKECEAQTLFHDARQKSQTKEELQRSRERKPKRTGKLDDQM